MIVLGDFNQTDVNQLPSPDWTPSSLHYVVVQWRRNPVWATHQLRAHSLKQVKWLINPLDRGVYCSRSDLIKFTQPIRLSCCELTNSSTGHLCRSPPCQWIWLDWRGSWQSGWVGKGSRTITSNSTLQHARLCKFISQKFHLAYPQVVLVLVGLSLRWCLKLGFWVW